MSSPGTHPSVKIAPPPREIEREPLVLNNRSLAWISDQIAGIIEGKTPRWWWVMMACSLPLMLMCFAMIGYLIYRCRSLGFEPSDRMGLGYCEFRVLDWYWSCWNFDFSSIVSIEAEMENIDQ